MRAQHRLLSERFGIERLELVLGWSMGAEQTYEWAVRFPDMVKRALPFAGTAKTTPHDYIFVRSHEDALNQTQPGTAASTITRAMFTPGSDAMRKSGRSWGSARISDQEAAQGSLHLA